MKTPYTPEKQAQVRAACLHLIECQRARTSSMLEGLHDKSGMARVIDHLESVLRNVADGIISLGDAVRSECLPPVQPDPSHDVMTRERLEDLYELATRSLAMAQTSLLEMEDTKQAVLARAVDQAEAEAFLAKLEADTVERAAYAAQEVQRYREMLAAPPGTTWTITKAADAAQ